MNELRKTVEEGIDRAYEDGLMKIVGAVKESGISRPVQIWYEQVMSVYPGWHDYDKQGEKAMDVNLSYNPQKGGLTGKVIFTDRPPYDLHPFYPKDTVVKELKRRNILLRRDQIKNVLAEVSDRGRFLAEFADSAQRESYVAEVFDLFVEGAKNTIKASRPNKQGTWTFFDFSFKPSFNLSKGERESARVVFDYSYFLGDGRKFSWEIRPVEGSIRHRTVSSLGKPSQCELTYDLRSVYLEREHIAGKYYKGSGPINISDKDLDCYEQQGWEFLEGMLVALRAQVAEKRMTRKRPNEL